MTAQSRDVEFDSLMGQSATVSLSVGSLVRTYNGIIGRFEQDGTPLKPLDMWTVYRATLYPKLWLLNFSGQCRIFQNKTALEIIQSVLDDNKITYSNQVQSSGMYRREFCVQYNETDYNFICRLMEEEGIFYFFQQVQESHTLVLADSLEAYLPCPNAPSASFHDASPHAQSMGDVSSCFITQRIVPQSSTLKSYNYLSPQTLLKANAKGNSDAGGGEITTYDEIYEKQTRGDELVKVQLQAEELPQKMVEGLSAVPFFLAGYKFNLEGHPRKDANLAYVLYEVIHEARIVADGEENPLYKNTYRAFSSKILFRPAQKTSKPRIYSTQTAKVTGKKGEEIYTEEYGRIKVKFHWDPSTKDDETTSCWIRVATLWSGKKWGTLFTPRVGQEVVVSFIDGDPDRPLIIGSVYNGEHKPPHLPHKPTISTIKSQSSKEEGLLEGFNELRFEDERHEEEIYIHAQKNFKIDIQNDHDVKIVGGSRTVTLEAKTERRESSGEMKGDDTLKLMNGEKSLQIIQGDYVIKLDNGKIDITCLSGNVSFDVTGDISFKCTGNFNVDAAQGISLKAGEKISADAGTDFSANAGGIASLKAGGDATVEGGGALGLTGGGTASLKGATVEVEGALITLNG